MKTLVVVGHPDLASSVVNKAWVEALRPYEGEQLKIHNLGDVIREDGTFDLKSEQRLLEQYDRIVLQFPLYWYMPPAILKLWMDTVWAEGWAWGDCPHALEGKLIEAATSCGAPEVAFSQTPLSTYLSFVQGSAGFVKARGGDYFAFYGAEGEGSAERLKTNCKEYIKFICDK
ncbi:MULTISPECIES: NAD(P)H-dependent oxidoreductase [environmental samples]|uniref:NAD(P)H-dependent oxidoreductase n=1 Tax=environmental samples TaxID=134245 RepID=UPI00033782D4|nr:MULTISPECIES: NAD(P)H-dependent oxidoreductase [environmental samples]CCY12136.1 nAD(P)H dehydrogenase quinone family putative [Porphyromonas sp. CAG:1061]